uniref:Uncharacterized protein n=1 Tax=Rhizophora mucronata TaxID=61149 RepID=A0A2P2PNG2_RHIMU
MQNCMSVSVFLVYTVGVEVDFLMLLPIIHHYKKVKNKNDEL